MSLTWGTDAEKALLRYTEGSGKVSTRLEDGGGMLRFGRFVRAANVADALEVLKFRKGAQVLGGGMWMRLSDRTVPCVIDLSDCGLDTIEETDGIGRIEIAGTNKKSIDDAIRLIKNIVAVPEVGETYKGKVRSVMPYGAFVEFLPGKDGLLHISEVDWRRFETIEETGLKEGDEIDVKLMDIDPKTGKFKLSHKALLPKPEGMENGNGRGDHGRRERRPHNSHKE